MSAYHYNLAGLGIRIKRLCVKPNIKICAVRHVTRKLMSQDITVEYVFVW